MSEKAILWIAAAYVVFLALISVKIGEYFEVILLRRKQHIPHNLKRTIGLLAILLALIPLRNFIPEFSGVFFVMYVVLALVWGIVYFDYIAKR